MVWKNPQKTLTSHCRCYCLLPNLLLFRDNPIKSLEWHLILSITKGTTGPVILACQNFWTRWNLVAAPTLYTHKSLHIIHGAQVVPDHFGWDLPSNILAEFIPDTNHVEMAIHTWGKNPVQLILPTVLFMTFRDIKKFIYLLMNLESHVDTRNPYIIGETAGSWAGWSFTLHCRCCSLRSCG